MQDGSNGDLIQVESLDSKQRYDARVVGLREASVFAPTRGFAASATERKTARVLQTAAPTEPIEISRKGTTTQSERQETGIVTVMLRPQINKN